MLVTVSLVTGLSLVLAGCSNSSSDKSYYKQQRSYQQAKHQHLKWITVSGKSVAVSPKLYDKIKVGDHVQLIDDTHIKINHHVYKR